MMASNVGYLSLRMVFVSSQAGISRYLDIKDCSHKESVSFGSRLAQRKTNRQSQLSVDM